MAELKTKENDASVTDFLANVEDEQQRKDAQKICRMLTEVSGEDPKMWGTAIVGFGLQHLVYSSGRELDWLKIGFSPRKSSLTLYIMDGLEAHAAALAKLGPYKTGKGCLYIKRLDDIDEKVLKQICVDSLGNIDAGKVNY